MYLQLTPNKILKKYLNTLDNIFKIIARCEDGEKIDNFLEVPMVNNFFKRLN